MNEIAFLPDAEQEMISAAKFYESIAEGFGDDFLAEVKRALRSIQKNPDRWPVVEENIRKHRMNRFPFYIVYFIRGEVIIIIAIAHQKRRPGYWKNRIKD